MLTLHWSSTRSQGSDWRWQVSDYGSSSQIHGSSCTLFKKTNLSLKMGEQDERQSGQHLKLDNADPSHPGEVADATHVEEDLSYAKSSLEVEGEEKQGVHNILGIQWDITHNDFHFNIGGLPTLWKTLSRLRGALLVLQPTFFIHLELSPQ